MGNIFRWNLRNKLLVTMSSLILVQMFVTTYLNIESQREVMEQGMDRRIALVKEQLYSKGNTLSNQLVTQVQNGLVTFDLQSISIALHEIEKKDPELSYVILMAQSSRVFVHTMTPALEQEKLESPEDKFAVEQRLQISREVIHDDEKYIENISPIQIGNNFWGVLRLGFSLVQVEEEILKSKAAMEDEIDEMIISAIKLSILFLSLCIVGVLLIATGIARPLVRLAEAAKKLAGGDFDAGEGLEIRTKGEIGLLSNSFAIMSKDLKASYTQLQEYSQTLEHKVAERTSELKLAFEDLEESHAVVNSSIQYASRIQRSILTPESEIKAMVPDHFILWEPRDIVGGDIYWCKGWGDGYLLILGDCTGHGVPGAFMTLLSNGALQRASMEVAPGNVEELLQRMHQILQTTLNQCGKHGHSDDGIEMGVCYLNAQKSRLLFAGARFDLYLLNDGEVNIIRGTKSGMGYRGIPFDQQFESQEIKVQKNMTILLTSDGYIDQIGGERKRMFGKRRLRELLLSIQDKPMSEQKEIILKTILDYQGDEKRRDDISVVGFKFSE